MTTPAASSTTAPCGNAPNHLDLEGYLKLHRIFLGYEPEFDYRYARLQPDATTRPRRQVSVQEVGITWTPELLLHRRLANNFDPVDPHPPEHYHVDAEST